MGSQVLSKHADAEEPFASDFSAQLAELGAASLVADTAEVKVRRGSATDYDPDLRRDVQVGPWTDVTPEFVTGDPKLNADLDQVIYTLKKRAGSEQVAGTYVVWCRVQTNTGAWLVDTYELKVLDTGSVPD